MTTIEEMKNALADLKGKPKFKKQLEFASLLTEFFASENIRPIVVGGLAVEIYTRNDYHTHDIDFVSDGWHKFDELLREIGFTKTEREWYHLETEIAVEVPSNYLDGSLDLINELELPNGKKIFVIGVEDLIIDRLEGISRNAPYPENDEDYEWAYRMYLIHKEELDQEYLMNQAKKVNVSHFMDRW
ncbi:hypothetical protein CEY16_13125 [Halalkalibacillus sediminis]|uniref:UbiD family decarboxylase n=1 Tax=Halalkalibacillus sediminis TaxID=2018042 RepID=A0A2I0QQZ6_9BACI|nr:hypothetical protein [Halalkalibacillus sediminis]PKR76756.1 hypothetical protein CEY16_13125 [Halalkalibacillus sediminis]